MNINNNHIPCLACNKSFSLKPNNDAYTKYACNKHFELIASGNDIITFTTNLNNSHILYHHQTASINLSQHNQVSAIPIPIFTLQELQSLKDYLHSLLKFNAFM